MDTSLRNISGLLGSLGRPLAIESTNERKLLQKLVYLGQQLGLPTKYSFSWYIHGPYSPRLTQDYFDLDAELKIAPETPQYFLSKQYDGIAKKINQLLELKPAKAPEADWAELLASIIFLRHESDYDAARTKETLKKKKAHVVPYLAKANEALSAVGLI